MSATSGAIQVQRVRTPISALVILMLVVGILGFVSGRITDVGTTQPHPAIVQTERALPISGLATTGQAAIERNQAIGQLLSLRVDSTYDSPAGLMKARMYEALGRLSVGSGPGGGSK
jgi:hypothetical protein